MKGIRRMGRTQKEKKRPFLLQILALLQEGGRGTPESSEVSGSLSLAPPVAISMTWIHMSALRYPSLQIPGISLKNVLHKYRRRAEEKHGAEGVPQGQNGCLRAAFTESGSSVKSLFDL